MDVYSYSPKNKTFVPETRKNVTPNIIFII